MTTTPDKPARKGRKPRDQYGKVGKLTRKTVRSSAGGRASTKDKIYACQTGTRSVLGEPTRYTDLAGARGKAREALLEWRTWCARHNVRGEMAVVKAMEAVEAWHGDPDRRIECNFDSYSGMHMVVVLFRTTPEGRPSGTSTETMQYDEEAAP